MMLLRFLLLLAITVRFGLATEGPPATWLSDDYSLRWTLGANDIELHLEVTGATWLGIGIGEEASGSMAGSDIVLVEANEAGVYTAVDTFALEFAKPPTDASQDWQLVSSEVANGVLMVDVKRALDTGDRFDRPFEEGPMRVVWAFGSGSGVSYHSSNRGSTTVTFWGNEDVFPAPSDVVLVHDMHMDNYTIPTQVTTYACKSAPLPIHQEFHIVEMEVILQPESAKYVHHLLVHLCHDVPGGHVETYDTADTCRSPQAVIPGIGCESVLFAWAKGNPRFRLPSNVGYPVGKDIVHYVVLDIHYDNPELDSGVVDNTGFRLHLADRTREHDAGVMVLGDVMVRKDPIMPGREYAHIESSCLSDCTANWPHPIHIFGDYLHMHETGKQMWSTISDTQGQHRMDLGRVDYYSFAFQTTVSIAEPVTVQPGERINTHCVFDTTQRDHLVEFGPASSDEMCLEYIMYYPVVPSPHSAGASMTFCGKLEGLTACSSTHVVESGMQGLMKRFNPGLSMDAPGGDALTFGPDSHTKVDHQPLVPEPCQHSDNASCKSDASGCVWLEQGDKTGCRSTAQLLYERTKSFIPLIVPTAVPCHVFAKIAGSDVLEDAFSTVECGVDVPTGRCLDHDNESSCLTSPQGCHWVFSEMWTPEGNDDVWLCWDNDDDVQQVQCPDMDAIEATLCPKCTHGRQDCKPSSVTSRTFTPAKLSFQLRTHSPSDDALAKLGAHQAILLPVLGVAGDAISFGQVTADGSGALVQVQVSYDSVREAAVVRDSLMRGLQAEVYSSDTNTLGEVLDVAHSLQFTLTPTSSPPQPTDTITISSARAYHPSLLLVAALVALVAVAM